MQGVVDRDALVVDFLRIADHARHGSESAGDAHRAGIGEGRQASLEHARIEFVGFAIDVHVATREVGAHQRIAARDHPGREFVDEGVLGTAQGGEVEAGGGEEGARIDAPAVRGIEQDRPAPVERLLDFERRIEFLGGIHRGGLPSGRPAEAS